MTLKFHFPFEERKKVIVGVVFLFFKNCMYNLSIPFVSQLADVSIDRLLHHGKARWLNCPDDVIRSGTLKKYPVSPRIGKKMTPGTMHLFGNNY